MNNPLSIPPSDPAAPRASATEPADPPMIVRSAAPGGFIRTNGAFRATVGFSDAALSDGAFVDWVDSADWGALQAVIAGEKNRCSVRHRTFSGIPLELEVLSTKHGDDTVLLAQPPSETRPGDFPKDSDDEATVVGTLHTIAHIIEEENPGYRCSILLVADGRLVRGVGPSLPEDYNAAIDGLAVGPTVGSCGTAIHWNVPVIVEDIQADPLWRPFAELAMKAGVAACWSYPFASKTGRVLGALALYAPEPRAPTPQQLRRLKAAARMTGLAVERGRAEEAFREKRKRELELEEQLRQAAKMEALGVLAGGVAHDFNNLLATVLGNAEFARDILPADSPARPMLADIVTASRRAGEFCKQMLAYAGRGAFRTARINLQTLLPELSGLVRAALSKKTQLEYKLADEPIFVDGDENQLLQVILNLITNAAEAIGEAGGRITLYFDSVSYDEATLRLLEPRSELSAGEYARLRVNDTGVGIHPDILARIFDPFFSSKATGRGLGLSAVKGIVAKHGGTVRIESEVGRGTTFTVLIPRVSVAADKVETTGESPVEAAGRIGILVADDEADLRSIMSRRLKHSGFHVFEAVDGQHAMEVFLEHSESIDCALLDLSMPRLGGVEVAQQLQAIRKNLPIVLMSGLSEQEVLDRIDDTGIKGILQKPITAQDLLGAIGKATAAV